MVSHGRLVSVAIIADSTQLISEKRPKQQDVYFHIQDIRKKLPFNVVYLIFFLISNVPWILMIDCPTVFFFSAELHEHKIALLKIINGIVAVKQQQKTFTMALYINYLRSEGKVFESRKLSITAKIQII